MREDAGSEPAPLSAFDLGAEGLEAFLDTAKPAVDLRDVADLGFPIGA